MTELCGHNRPFKPTGFADIGNQARLARCAYLLKSFVS
jgi:hypothetical protein